MDRQFIRVVETIMREQGIASDRSMSKLLDQHENFISRIRTGVQSVPANIWGLVIQRYNVTNLSLVDDDPITTNNISRHSGNVIGNNSGSSVQTIGDRSTKAETGISEGALQEKLRAAEEKIAMLTSQLADKERTIQILLKQNS